MFKLNITATLNKQRPNTKDECAIRIRTTIKRHVTYYPTGISVKKEDWNGKEVINHPKRSYYNSIIRNAIVEIEQKYLEQGVRGESVTQIKKTTIHTFKEYAEKVIKDDTGTLSAGRIEQKRHYLKKFLEFNSTIKLKDVTKDTLIAFENFCRRRGNNENTVHSNTSFIKSILNAAVRDGVLQSSPAFGFKGAKYINPMKVVLTPAELKKFEKFADNEKHAKVLRNVAAWFIFSCRTGLRYSDMARFKGFVNDRILIQTEKTKEIVSLPATPKIIEANARLTSDIISNQKMNTYLKILADSLGIEKRVTVHLGRHFFGVNWLQSGGDIHTLMKLMGHSNIKMTSVYSKVSNTFIDAEMLRVLG